MTQTLIQLATNTNLLPEAESKAILSGGTPPLADLIQHLLIGSMDAHAGTAGDRNASWIQRRIARQLLGLTFMTALLFEKTLEPETKGGPGTTAAQEKTT